MGKHVTHKQAFRALCDPDVPLEDAFRLVGKAHRRSNEATRVFTVGFGLSLRAHQIEKRNNPQSINKNGAG